MKVGALCIKKEDVDILTHPLNLGSGSEREIDDILLTRYGCYLIAQNGDPRKEQTSTYRSTKAFGSKCQFGSSKEP